MHAHRGNATYSWLIQTDCRHWDSNREPFDWQSNQHTRGRPAMSLFTRDTIKNTAPTHKQMQCFLDRAAIFFCSSSKGSLNSTAPGSTTGLWYRHSNPSGKSSYTNTHSHLGAFSRRFYPKRLTTINSHVSTLTAESTT